MNLFCSMLTNHFRLFILDYYSAAVLCLFQECKAVQHEGLYNPLFQPWHIPL